MRQGEGGDDTTAIDQAAEDAILARFRDLDVTIVSEEIGLGGVEQAFSRMEEGEVLRSVVVL